MDQAQGPKLFKETKFEYGEKRKAMISIVNVLSQYKLSHNQAVEVLDCVKEELNYIPLWR